MKASLLPLRFSGASLATMLCILPLPARENPRVDNGWRFTELTEPKTDVKVYSNAGRVELKVNGVSRGQLSAGKNHIIIWHDVVPALGENRVEVTAVRDGKPLSERCTGVLKP